MKIWVLEKKRKIGEINGENILVWEFFTILPENSIQTWCKERGYYVDWRESLIGDNIRFQDFYL